ncbi:MAG: hypothetical protein ACI37T_06460 [Candidatus Gastranaerophilaceae bacterium]
MPRAINYASYDKNNEDNSEIDANTNEIFKTVNKFFNDKDENYWKDIAERKNNKESEIPTYYFDLYKILKDELKFEENKTYLSVDNESKKWYKNATKNKERVKIFLDTNCNNRPFKQDNDKLIYNFAWDKYSRGLMDVLIELKLGKTIIQENKKDINKSYVEFITEICQESDNLNENSYDEQFNKLKSLIKTFHKNIFSISDTLSLIF